jgi:hypothetical protein
MKKMLVAALILPMGLLGAARPARASDKAAAIFAGVAVGVGAALIFDALVPRPVVAAPVVYQPVPVVVQAPPPVIVMPPPVVYQAPVVYGPAPVIVRGRRHVAYTPRPVYVRDRHVPMQRVPSPPRYIHDQ